MTQQQHTLSGSALERIVALRQAAMASIDRTRESLAANAKTQAARDAASQYRSMPTPPTRKK
jgi:hypothetical protein